MVEGEIIGGNIGSIGHYDVKFENLQLVLEGSAKYQYGESSVAQKINAKVILDAIKAAHPGIIASAVGVLEAALFGA